MVPSTTSLLTAFLALGGLDLVSAEAPTKPRFIPKQLKRQINYKVSSDLASRTASENRFESWLKSLGQDTTASQVDPSPPVVVIPITLSIDANGVTHTLTGTVPTAPAGAKTVTSATSTSEKNSVLIPTATSDSKSAASEKKTSPQPTAAGSTSASGTQSSNSASSSDDANLGDEIGSFFNSIFNPSSSTTGVSASATDSVSGSTSAKSKSTSDSSSVDANKSTGGPKTDDATVTSTGMASSSDASSSATATPSGLLNGISDLWDDITGKKTETGSNSTATATGTGLAGKSTSSLEPTGTGILLPTVNISIPDATSTAASSIDLGASLSSAFGMTGTGIPSSTSAPGPSVLIPGGPGSHSTFGPSLSTISPSVPTGAATSGPVIPTSTAPASSGPAIGSTQIPSPTSKPAPTSTAKPAPTSTEQPTTTETTESITTQEPATSTSSESNDWIPSTILVEPPTPATTDYATHDTATATNTPTQLPGSISPATGLDNIPADSTLIQLGFDGRLRYNFVATTTLSSSQIFLYIPQGLEYALQVLAKQITMFAIKPYDNSESTGYIATVAQAYIPNDQVDGLRKMLHNPISRLYEQPSESVKTLLSMIDPSIPLVVGQTPSSPGGDSSDSNGSDDGNHNGDNNESSDNNSDGGASSSGSTKASSVGIGVGVVAGAAAYGAGMFWIARRYRKKRQLHQRSSSTVEQMSEGPGAGSVFASGGRLSRNSQNSGSARTQMISAPVMAENSLGWN
ncbi:hypothetical protein FE257_002006 [Aspergillus nanangensis]|uniref:Mucin family signaling protein Msb2 n=1 Tax=Aspergillus nanangensis TaxID=2582783 RepID=A0AAD4CT61_ASPNN|nr:hypothetical protein FE257_002006 [Aspergillus nanangensis]